MASKLEMMMSRLDIRCDHLESLQSRLPKSVTDSLIHQVREVITEFYAEERKKADGGQQSTGHESNETGSESVG